MDFFSEPTSKAFAFNVAVGNGQIYMFFFILFYLGVCVFDGTAFLSSLPTFSNS